MLEMPRQKDQDHLLTLGFVKCDETKPGCLACRRIGVECVGYDAKFIWVDTDGSISSSQGRRVLPCETTWKGFEILPTDLVDLLIARCDEECNPDHFMSMAFTASCKMAHHNPFSVIAFDPPPCNLSSTGSSTDPSTELMSLAFDESFDEPSLNIFTFTAFPDKTSSENFLFHHYVSHVAVIMLPYEHPRNHWKSTLPAVALELASSNQEFLYNALLSHAAFNVAHLRGDDAGFLRRGMKYYGNAMQALIQAIDQDVLDFPATIASIMTLLFAELYNGPARSWRRHFDGAWALLQTHSQFEPWKATDMACVSLQSLNIVKIIGDTSKSKQLMAECPYNHASQDQSSTLVSPVLSTSGFGFTIGAQREILNTIARITSISQERTRGLLNPDDIDEKLAHELVTLNRYRKKQHNNPGLVTALGAFELDENYTTEEMPEEVPEQTHQQQAFVQATYIYLYRSLLDAPPKAVQAHVSQTFAHVTAYSANIKGNFSLWPAFIAAVEAYTAEDLEAAKEWLASATSFGIGSRKSIRTVVEEIWHRREAISESSGLEVGLVAIDWREVMQELDCDVLLV